MPEVRKVFKKKTEPKTGGNGMVGVQKQQRDRPGRVALGEIHHYQ